MRIMCTRYTIPALCIAVVLAGAPSARADDRSAADNRFWDTVKSCTDTAEIEPCLRKFPKGLHVAEARDCFRKPEFRFWRMVRSENTRAAYALYLKFYPNGIYAEMAKKRLLSISALV